MSVSLPKTLRGWVLLGVIAIFGVYPFVASHLTVAQAEKNRDTIIAYVSTVAGDAVAYFRNKKKGADEYYAKYSAEAKAKAETRAEQDRLAAVEAAAKAEKQAQLEQEEARLVRLEDGLARNAEFQRATVETLQATTSNLRQLTDQMTQFGEAFKYSGAPEYSGSVTLTPKKDR